LGARAQTIERLQNPCRLALLLAFATQLEAASHDDALDSFSQIVTDLFTESERCGQQARLRTLNDLDAAALRLRAACQIVLNRQHPGSATGNVLAFDYVRQYPTVFLKMTGLRLNEFADLLNDVLPRFARAEQHRRTAPRGSAQSAVVAWLTSRL
jgi:hypothetical protein